MAEMLSYGFMQNALMAAVLVSLVSGVIGTLVVLKRMVFISGGVAHTAYGGVGLAFYFGVNPILGAVAFSLLASFLMGYVQRKTRQRQDTLIGVMWAIGMAIGIIFADLTPGYKADLMSYLFGSILAVTNADLLLMLAVDILVISLVVLFYKELQATAFDETFARVRNLPVDLLYVILIAMIGLSVVMLMRVVGLIMIIALLTVPAAIGAMYLKNMKHIMWLATGLSLVFTIGGLLISYTYNLSSGATIILVSGGTYLIALALHRFCRRCPN
ncbi:MAG: metal ABC transporter permease [Chloroflexota bacterium]|nr:metal ABC transporter permease [Chloroflexota bacterium]